MEELATTSAVHRLAGILQHVKMARVTVAVPDPIPALEQPLQSINCAHLTDKDDQPFTGVQGLSEAGFKMVAYFCGSLDVQAWVRVEACSYVCCRLVMEDAAVPKCAGKKLKPHGWGA